MHFAIFGIALISALSFIAVDIDKEKESDPKTEEQIEEPEETQENVAKIQQFSEI